jgi:hypothetical protein
LPRSPTRAAGAATRPVDASNRANVPFPLLRHASSVSPHDRHRHEIEIAIMVEVENAAVRRQPRRPTRGS